MNYRFNRILLVIVGSCLMSSAFAAQVVYVPPTVPAGMDRTMVAAPQRAWARHVQENFDRTQGKHFDLVFDGDSIMAGWNWEGRGQKVWDARYTKLHATDFGIAGDQVQNVLWRLRKGQLDGINPSLIVFMIGANNIMIGNDPPEQIAAGIKVVLAEYLKDAPSAKLLLLGCLPFKADKATDPSRAKAMHLNTLISPLADGKRISYLDIGPILLNPDGSLRSEMFVADRVHLSDKGYQAWADMMQPVIDKSFPALP